MRIAIASTEGPSELGELADVVVGSTDAFLELLARSSRAPSGRAPRATWRASDVELGARRVGELQPEAVRHGRRTAATFARLTRYERWMRAKRAAEPLLELAERRGAEVRAVVRVHAAVVAVSLHVVDLVEVEQLGPAAGDDGDLARRERRSRASARASRSTTRASRSGSTGFSR